jgi:hypothetical protein
MIYAGDYFTLKVGTGIDLTAATVLKIKYIDPLGNSGEWTATIDSVDNTKMNVVFAVGQSVTSLTIVGQWQIWSFATFSTGNIIGELAVFTINEAP